MKNRRRRGPNTTTLSNPLTLWEAITHWKLDKESMRAVLTELIALEEHGEIAFYLTRSEKYIRVTLNGICELQLGYNWIQWSEWAPPYAESWESSKSGEGYLTYPGLIAGQGKS